MELGVTKIPQALSAGDHAQVASHLDSVRRTMPGNPEILFWTAVSMANAGDLDRAVALFTEAIACDPGWRGLIEELPASGVLSLEPNALETLLGRLETK